VTGVKGGERRHVELVEHSPAWASEARASATRIAAVLGTTLVEIHHVGSTSIAGIRAKPIIDLLPVVTDLGSLDAAADGLRALGYQWRGEFGIAGRRYCTLDDPATGRRLVQLHAFAVAHPEIDRMLMFRNYLRTHPGEARAYEAEKERCRVLHPDDTMAYAEEKTVWINSCVARARGAGATETRDS
jgi:GrpB-like predicted nucleotidyltransferase (UPF0157 family)